MFGVIDAPGNNGEGRLHVYKIENVRGHRCDIRSYNPENGEYAGNTVEYHLPNIIEKLEEETWYPYQI